MVSMFGFGKKKNAGLDTLHVTDQSFKTEVLQSEVPVLVDFWAPWCGPCKTLGPIVDELATEYKDRVRVTKVNVDQNPKLSQAFNVRSIPTMAFIKEGRLIEQLSGLVSKPNLAEMLDDLIVFEVVVDEEE
jgi:thioredoxin 1